MLGQTILKFCVNFALASIVVLAGTCIGLAYYVAKAFFSFIYVGWIKIVDTDDVEKLWYE